MEEGRTRREGYELAGSSSSMHDGAGTLGHVPDAACEAAPGEGQGTGPPQQASAAGPGELPSGPSVEAPSSAWEDMD